MVERRRRLSRVVITAVKQAEGRRVSRLEYVSVSAPGF